MKEHKKNRASGKAQKAISLECIDKEIEKENLSSTIN